MEHPVDDDEGNLAMCRPAPAVVQFQVLTKMGKGPERGAGIITPYRCANGSPL